METNELILSRHNRLYLSVLSIAYNVILLVAVAKKTADFGANTTNTKQTFN